MPWREIEHTADWAIVVDGPDFPALLRESALGMYALAGVAPAGGEEASFVVSGIDREAQLVAFLTELIYWLEAENAAYHALDVSIDDDEVVVRGMLATVGPPSKLVKAVTFHGLEIEERDGGVHATVIFDV